MIICYNFIMGAGCNSIPSHGFPGMSPLSAIARREKNITGNPAHGQDPCDFLSPTHKASNNLSSVFVFDDLRDLLRTLLASAVQPFSNNGIESCLKEGQVVAVAKEDGSIVQKKINQVFIYRGLKRMAVEEAVAGDIVVVSGIADISIGETICDPADPQPMEMIEIEFE